MACAFFLPDCPQCHPVLDDAWRFDGKYVTRVHHRPRYRLFTPTGAGAVGIPVAVEKLLNHRTTKIVESGGSASISHVDEDWKDSTVSNEYLPYLWVGESVFEVAGEHVEAERHRCTQLQDSGAIIQLAGAKRHRCTQLQGSGASIRLAGAERHHCTQLQGSDRVAGREQTAAVGSERSGPTDGRPVCCCFLPDCETCSKRSMTAARSSSAHALGRGNSMPARGLRAIAEVHDELQKMLQEGKGWLAKGPMTGPLSTIQGTGATLCCNGT